LQLLKGRQTLVGARTKLINSLRGIAKPHGIGFGPCGMTKWAAAVEKKCPAQKISVERGKGL